jgi:hypothetical protein
MPFDDPTAARWCLTGMRSRDPDDKPQPECHKSCLAKALLDLDRDMRMPRAWLALRAGANRAEHGLGGAVFHSRGSMTRRFG